VKKKAYSLLILKAVPREYFTNQDFTAVCNGTARKPQIPNRFSAEQEKMIQRSPKSSLLLYLSLKLKGFKY
jgi:hypothetical protein